MSFTVHFIKEIVLEMFFHAVIITVEVPFICVHYTCVSYANMTTPE